MGKSVGRIVAGALIVAGCTHTNVQLNRQEVPLESRIHNNTRATLSAQSVPEAPNNDGYFVGLALSGGGSRSANFSAGCMFQLEKLGILQRVDYISSVSGGSLTAAYYCLSAKDWNPGEVQRRLAHPFASDVIFAALMPWNAILLLMTPWNRSDILADSFDRVLYSHDGRAATFADLRADRPRLLINATDLQSGSKFIFCNETFDDLNSDLSKYRVSYAVAASAAVPVLLHQVTLHDFSTVFQRYRHLIDGGITDNLGVTTLVEAYTAQVDRAKQTHQPDPYPHGLILIVVDAHTSVDAEIDNKPDIGILDSLEAAAGLSTTVLLNRISSATLAEIIVKYSPNDMTAQKLRQQIAELEKVGVLETRDRDGKPVKVIHLAMFRVGELSDLPFVSFGRSVNSIASYFNIDANEAYHLYKAADLLVNEEFQQPLQQIAHDLNQTESK